MKVDINKTYKTKSGLPVVIYAVYEGHKNYHVHGAYLEDDDDWHVTMWRLDGHFYRTDKPSEFDLVEVRPERVVWINEYENGCLTAHDSEEAANVLSNYSSSRLIALHRVVLNEDTVWQADSEREGDDE